VAANPHTGEILAASGSLAAHRFSSAFQPLVYAAGLNTALGGTPKVLTPSSTVIDEPTTFYVGNKAYEPLGASGEFQGQVSLRQALARSLVVPAVKVSEMVSYDRVAQLANSAGLVAVIGAATRILFPFRRIRRQS
jgi:membrane carboxypeptidase/penicillin-binding protein